MTALKAIFSRLRPGEDPKGLLAARASRGGQPERRKSDRRRDPPPWQDRETRLRFAAQAVGFGTYHFDCLSGDSYWSPELKAIAGLPPDWEQARMAAVEALETLVHPEDRQHFTAKMKGSLDPRGTGQFEDEFRLLRPDGSVRWVEARGRSFFGGEGAGRHPLGALGAIADVTASRQAELALRRSQQDLELAVHGAALGIWNWNLRTGHMTWSDRCYQLVGLPPGEPVDFDRFLATLHPEDRDKVNQAVRRALESAQESSVEYRCIFPDGSIHWNVAVGRVYHDEATGESLRMTGIAIDVTERKAVEEAFRQQAEQLRLALKAGRSGVFDWDPRTGESHWSDELLALYGIAPEQFTGRYEDWLEALLPEDRPAGEAAVLRSLQTGEFSLEFRIRRRDTGEVRWMHGRGEVFFDGDGKPRRVIGIDTDITERKAAEAKMRQQTTLLDLAPDPIMVWEDRGGIRYWNNGCAELYGYSSAEAQGRVSHELLKTVFPVSLEACLADIARTGRWSGELRQVTRDGRQVVVESRMQGLQVEGRWLILEANRSITERKALEEALRHTNEELENRIAERTAELVRSNEALERSNLELQQFAFIAAHDLQTPLRSISGFAQLMQTEYQGRLDAQADAWLNRLIQSAQRMHELVRDLLAYSQVESRGSAFRPTDFRQIFDDVVATLEGPIREAGARVTRDELPVVEGDRTQLAQVLQNLIDNAIKYRGPEPPRVHVAARLENGEWLFSVRDNGIGIAEKHQERIFDIFRRLHTQQEYPGTGIGLAICRRVIHRHGGRIWVKSEPGKGSTFYFSLPARSAE